MPVRAALLLVLTVVLGAPACERAGEPPAPGTGEPVVDLSEPILPEDADPPAGGFGLAPILPSTFNGVDPSLFKWENPEGQKPDRSSPLVAVESRVLRVAPGFSARLAGEADGPTRRVARDVLESFLEKERAAHEVEQISGPSLTVYSGQLSHTLVVSQEAYIQDYTPAPTEDGADGVGMQPKIGVLNTGSVLLARPVAVDGGIEIRDLGVEVAEKLGTRGCKAVVEHGGESQEVIWEEPVLLVAKPDPSLPRALPLREDETLVIPLYYEVRQACANVRALVARDSLEETLRQSAGPALRECVVLVEARRLPPPTEE